MSNVLKIFLSLSLSGSLLILALFLCKPILKGKLNKRWQYYIWLVVIARLLLPFAPDTNLMGSAFQSIENAILQAHIAPLPQTSTSGLLGTDMPILNNGGASHQEAADEIPAPPSNQSVQDMINLLVDNLGPIWLTTALVLIIRKITIYQSFARYVEAGRAPVTDTGLLDQMAFIGEQASVKRVVELCVNPLISSPLLIGFFRPCIVLPSTDISETDFRYTVLHELTHYRRRDMFYKWLVQLTVCLHWFNPLVYFMGREINRACELSCDETIIAKLDYSNAQDYGKTLLDAMAAVGKYKEALASVSLSENKKLLKERLVAIMNYKKSSKMMIAITAICTFTICLSATFTGAYALDSSPNHAINRDSAAADKINIPENTLAIQKIAYKLPLENESDGDIIPTFTNGTPYDVTNINFRMKFPKGIWDSSIDYETKSFSVKSGASASYAVNFASNQSGDFTMAITSYTTTDGATHMISDQNLNWVQFYYPGVDMTERVKAGAKSNVDNDSSTNKRNGRIINNGEEFSRIINNGQVIISTSYFYANSTVLKLSWDIDVNKYPVKRDITISGSSYPVAFTDSTQRYSDNVDVLKALQEIILEQREEGAESINAPVVLNIAGPFALSKDQATQLYQNGDNNSFLAMYSHLNSPDKEYFAGFLYKNDTDLFLDLTLTLDETRKYVELSYNDNNENVFTWLVDDLPVPEQKDYLKRSRADGKKDFVFWLEED